MQAINPGINPGEPCPHCDSALREIRRGVAGCILCQSPIVWDPDHPGIHAPTMQFVVRALSDLSSARDTEDLDKADSILIGHLLRRDVFQPESIIPVREERRAVFEQHEVRLPLLYFGLREDLVTQEQVLLAISEIQLQSQETKTLDDLSRQRTEADRVMEHEGLIANYRVLRELGRGGGGIVYHVVDIHTSANYALKYLAFTHYTGSSIQQRFNREISAVQELVHPNIIEVHDFGVHEGLPFFCMEYIDGITFGDLIEYVNQNIGIPNRNVLAGLAGLLLDIVDAISYAHERKIVHRDIKPENILITSVGEPKLSDFGLAKLMDDDASITASGDIVGTPHFMAPEQTLGDSMRATAATDVYSLGVCLYLILTGRLPFYGDSNLDLFRAVCQSTPIAPRRINAAVPRSLERLCLRAMSKEPQCRYRSGKDLLAELRRAVTKEFGDLSLEREFESLFRSMSGD